MPRIRNVSPLGDLDVPLLGRVIAFGEEVDVDDETAVLLLDQAENYQPAKTAAATKKGDDS